VKVRLTPFVLAALVAAGGNGNPTARAQQQTPVPDAPTPQAAPSLEDTSGPITPGEGAGTESTSSSSIAVPVTTQSAAPSSQPPEAAPKAEVQTTPPEGNEGGEGVATTTRFVLNVNFVQVPVTVKDAKGNLVAGLTWRDFTVYENNVREQLRLFTVDPFPLSVAFVIDQSLTSDVMKKVNDSLGAIQGALTSYDEVAVFTYTNGAQERTGFTGAQSARLPAVLALAKATGTDMQVPINSGAFSGCSIVQNGNCVDPNLQPGRSAGNQSFVTIPKEIHTLNDAILAAAKELSSRPNKPIARRRMIFVVSDGKEYGSKASWKEVVRYLQTNEIAVYGTLVGDSARWGQGYISRFHLPFQMYDNILYKYTTATGGTLDAQNGVNGIEKSYASIAEQARTQYTLGYLSHESIYDGKFRKIDVRVNRPNLDVIAKPGYYPSAQSYK
jgi:VWFA-related protein